MHLGITGIRGRRGKAGAGLQRSALSSALLGVAIATFLAFAASPAAMAQRTAFAIAEAGTTLITFDTSNPGGASAVGNFTLNGQATFLDAIDFRPQDGLLYGYLDATDTLYQVDLSTAALTAIRTDAGASNTNLLGMDFNPLTGRARIDTDSTQNFSLNPALPAAPPIVQGNLFYPAGDPGENAPLGPRVIDIGYTNNIAGAFTGTTLFGIDYGTDTLLRINGGTGALTTVGALGVNINDAAPHAGFDIFTDGTTHTNTAYALLDTTAGNAPTFYTVALGTGAASSVGALGGGFTQVRSLAVRSGVVVIPEPGEVAFALVFGAGLLGLIGRARLTAHKRS